MSVLTTDLFVLCRCCLDNIGEFDLKLPYGIIVEALNSILLKFFGINVSWNKTIFF